MKNSSVFWASIARKAVRSCAILAVALVAGRVSHAAARNEKTEVPPPVRETTVAGVTARLETDDPFHIVRPGEEAKARFVVENARGAPAKARLEFEAESFDGSKTSGQAELQIAAKGAGEWAFSKETLGALGHRTIRFRLSVGDEASSMVECSLVYLTPTGRAADRGPGMLFGLAFGATPDNFTEESALVADLLGLDVVRLHFRWDEIEPAPNQWQWDRVDKTLGQYAAHGIKAEVLFSGTAEWAAKPSGRAQKGRPRSAKPGAQPPDPQAWETFVGAFAAHCQGRVSYYEIWNEPDIGSWGGTAEEYVDLLQRASRAIRAADPKAAVLTGGFVGGGENEKRKMELVERALSEGRDSFDMIAYHRHGSFKAFAKDVEEYLLPLRERTGNAAKPIYFTETAMDAKEGLRFQAETLVKKIAYSASIGAAAHTWFDLHDVSNDPTNTHFCFGLLTHDGQPKPDFAAYNTLTGQLRGMTAEPRPATAADVWALPFRRGQDWVAVCWREAENGPAELRVETDAQSAEVVDLMGVARPLPLSAGATAIPLSAAPVYARFTGASRLAVK
ncbi:MAG: cellulase family glycosylhydrolase [Candidatus Sumerlaeota bacterium]|nr:cellulase family glycosylhydrolase [Candidatus Sumerlaeota bacterium]